MLTEIRKRTGRARPPHPHAELEKCDVKRVLQLVRYAFALHTLSKKADHFYRVGSVLWRAFPHPVFVGLKLGELPVAYRQKKNHPHPFCAWQTLNLMSVLHDKSDGHGFFFGYRSTPEW